MNRQTSQKLAARVVGLATSTLANALDEVGLHANVMPSIKSVTGFLIAKSVRSKADHRLT